MVKALALIALLTLAGCQTSGSFCQLLQPERPSQAEIAVMSDERAAEILARNRLGQRLCGWRP